MSLSLTPVPNQSPTNCARLTLFGFLMLSLVLTGCGLKDELTLPDPRETETSLTVSMVNQNTPTTAENKQAVK